MKYYPGQILILKKPIPRTYRVLDVNPYGVDLEYWENDEPENRTKFNAKLSEMDEYLQPYTKLDKVLA